MTNDTDFKKQVIKALHQGIITKQEAKALIKKGTSASNIFLFADDMTETDYLIKLGLEKMGFYGGIILDGTSKDFLSVNK